MASATASDATPGSDHAPELVRAALRCEISGDETQRAALLQAALRIAPDDPLANSYLGRVRVGEVWRPIEEAQAYWSRDRKIAEYRQWRLLASETPESQLALADWCHGAKFFDEERSHLRKAFSLSSDSRLAMAIARRLGLRQYHGRWLPVAEIERRDRAEREVQRAMARWKPVLLKWRSDIEGGTATERQSALEQLRAVSDPTAFVPMETVLSRDSAPCAIEVVGLLGETQRRESTESLVRHAVWCRFPEVRAAAAEALRRRPMYNYVPLLLDGLAPPVEVTIEYPYGTPEYVRQTVQIKERDQDVVWVHHRFLLDNTLIFQDGLPWQLERNVHPGPQPGKFTDKDTPRTQLNERIQTVLCQVTGETYGEPGQWWDWWRRYNEYESPGERPTRAYSTMDETRHTKYKYTLRKLSGSCLAWGTPIWTQTGPVPVEKVQCGDRVLSQDADTGELAYRLVAETTIRRLGSMRRIHVGDESLTVTVGHPFWVVGKGWRMAKELEPGARLHTIAGGRTVDRIEELPEDAAYNLVVDGFHTYFAGQGRILVHDNTVPQPTVAIMPGLMRE